MGKVYVGQTSLIIRANCNEDISDWSNLLIKYRKPDKTTYGSFPASIYNATTGVIQYAVQNETDLDQAGIWIFWAYVTFSNGKSVPGEHHIERIHEEGL